jgi:VWFA-related protein
MVRVVKPVVFAGILAIAGSIVPATAQGSERAVFASVLGKDGAPVTTLEASDFIVREGDAQREVLSVEPASQPMRIAVLVDTSRAMHPYVNDLRRGLRSFFREMAGTHEIALYEFGDRPSRLVDYTLDADRLEAGVGRIFARPASGAYLLEAIIDASRDLRAREGARPVIIAITAEGPEFSDRFHQSVLDEVKSAGATLNSLVLTRRRIPLFNNGVREREFTLSKGAELTGGRREDLFTSMSLTDRLNDLARELKAQYRVVYAQPETLVPPDRIDVEVKEPALTVRAPRVHLNVRGLP